MLLCGVFWDRAFNWLAMVPITLKQVNFVFPNYFSMNDNVGRLSEFLNEIHQLMSNDGTSEGVQLRISE